MCAQDKRPATALAPKAKIAIIMDDIGKSRFDNAAFLLPKKVTFSILPHTDFSTQYSFKANQQGREVMLHMPMESLHGEALGEGALLANMFPDQVEETLLRAFDSVPHAVGVNNHMGSKLTQITLQMSALMDVLQHHELFFIDSKTTKYSKAKKIAAQYQVTHAARHIFLDHYQRPEFLQQQFNRLVRIARKYGKSIGIAHPYPVSIEFLQYALNNLPDDVELISASEYFTQAQSFRYVRPAIAKQAPPQTTQAPK